MKSTVELRDSRENRIPIAIAAAPAPAHDVRDVRSVASPRATRLLSLLVLAAMVVGLVAAARGAYRAMTDAWVAPLQLSPESREVVALRMQTTKDEEQRARAESELTSAAAEIDAIDLSLERLRTLAQSTSKAVRWSTSGRDDQLAALLEQKGLLERQRGLALEQVNRSRIAAEKARRDLEAGVITATDLEAARDAVSRTELTRNEKELEQLRVSAAFDEATREAEALASAPAGKRRGARLASPEVMRLDELSITTELQLARLGAERRAALAREQAARQSIKGIDSMQAQLESSPVFLAARRQIDLAFVPYAHLEGVREGDAVYVCRWFLFGCRETGRIKRFFPGEVVMDDPWGSVARGHYVELEMSDRSAMAGRTLRVRRRGRL